MIQVNHYAKETTFFSLSWFLTIKTSISVGIIQNDDLKENFENYDYGLFKWLSDSVIKLIFISNIYERFFL